MGWSGRTGSRVSQKGRPQQAYGNQDLFSSADNFQHPQNDHSHAKITGRRGPQGKHTLATIKIGPLDHKTANVCVSLAHTSFIFSEITKLSKS